MKEVQSWRLANIDPGAGGNAVLLTAGGLVVHKTTHDTDLSFHGNFQAMLVEARSVRR